MTKTNRKSQAINVSEFKAKALALIEETAKKGKEHLITKRGIPVARVIPVKTRTETRRGSLKGVMEIQGDIVHLDLSSEWEASHT